MKDARIDHAVAVCKKVVSSFSFSWKRRRDLVLTWQDLEVLESVHKALKPLLEFTDTLSGESYVTVSYVKPVLHLFQSSLLAHQEYDSPLTQSIKASILDYLREKYSDPSTDNLLDMAGLVDPRFKTTYCTKEKVEVIKSRAITEMEAMLSESDQGTDEMAASHSQPTEPLKKKTLGSFFKVAATSSATLLKRERVWKKSCLPTCGRTVLTVKQIPCNGGTIIRKCSRT